MRTPSFILEWADDLSIGWQPLGYFAPLIRQVARTRTPAPDSGADAAALPYSARLSTSFDLPDWIVRFTLGAV